MGNKVIEGVNLIKVHYMHIWKYHNETNSFAQLIYTNKKKTINVNNLNSSIKRHRLAEWIF
jgi:hypothetical protein